MGHADGVLLDDRTLIEVRAMFKNDVLSGSKRVEWDWMGPVLSIVPFEGSSTSRYPVSSRVMPGASSGLLVPCPKPGNSAPWLVPTTRSLRAWLSGGVRDGDVVRVDVAADGAQLVLTSVSAPEPAGPDDEVIEAELLDD